jgi:hypothetical protein
MASAEVCVPPDQFTSVRAPTPNTGCTPRARTVPRSPAVAVAFVTGPELAATSRKSSCKSSARDTFRPLSPLRSSCGSKSFVLEFDRIVDLEMFGLEPELPPKLNLYRPVRVIGVKMQNRARRCQSRIEHRAFGQQSLRSPWRIASYAVRLIQIAY